ncbi:MAG: 4-phosphopantetheinyl transferase, partial [Desulfovibrio fairfieldensis]|nr:4-phosphopantetheinyl transferase [Desulfovibrio fairfieldensis]
MKSPRENPAKQHVVLRPAPFDTETEGEEKVHVYLTHARDLMDLASPAQQGHGLEALLEREDPASALGRAFALLSPQEQYKALRFHRLNDGILYMASHAALRMLLSLEKGRRLPHEWLFASSNYGRPYLVADAFCDFNISHSWPWAAIAFCRHGRCGVDVELQEHLGDWQALIPLVCHENE